MFVLNEICILGGNQVYFALGTVLVLLKLSATKPIEVVGFSI